MHHAPPFRLPQPTLKALLIATALTIAFALLAPFVLTVKTPEQPGAKTNTAPAKPLILKAPHPFLQTRQRIIHV